MLLVVTWACVAVSNKKLKASVSSTLNLMMMRFSFKNIRKRAVNSLLQVVLVKPVCAAAGQVVFLC
jgi:hypothetical protein